MSAPDVQSEPMALESVAAAEPVVVPEPVFESEPSIEALPEVAEATPMPAFEIPSEPVTPVTPDPVALAQLDAELSAFDQELDAGLQALRDLDGELATLLADLSATAAALEEAAVVESTEAFEPSAAPPVTDTFESPTAVEPTAVEPTAIEPSNDEPNVALPLLEPTAPTQADLDWSDLAEQSALLYPPLPPTSGPLAAPTGPVQESPAALDQELERLLAEVGPRRAPVTTGPVPAPAPVTPEPATATTSEPQPEPVASTSTPADASPAPEGVEVLGPVAKQAVETGPRSVLRRAESEGMWQQVEVPNSVAHGPDFLLTPYTGNVRVVLDGGDVFEGRLHGAGAGRVSLDTRIGRMALDARRLQRIERLAPEGPAPKSPAKVTNDTTGLEEVRVVTHGGTFTGHLVAREGTKVTLMMPGGYRMSVEALEVTPAQGGRGTAQIKRPAEGKDGAQAPR